MRRRGAASIAASPVLVGAVTVLVAIVAVFLAYNANSGLPFVPTYDVRATFPNAANLVKGNEVRIGGARVGVIDQIEPVPEESGESVAVVSMKLDKDIEPIPIDSTFLIRPRSALGLKYVELTPGHRNVGYPAGSLIPIKRATPRPVELDEVFNTFNQKTRTGAQKSLNGFGEGLAGRGRSLNAAIAELNPLLEDLEPVARNLSAPPTRLDRIFKEIGDAAAEIAPVAEQQAALFVNLDTTFAALATVARPFVQQTITESPPTLATATEELPQQRAFLRNTAAFARELRPGVETLPASAPLLADALEFGTRTLPKTPPFNRRLANVFDALAEFAEDPFVPRGIERLSDTVRSLRPTLRFLTPVQTTCNYVTLWFRNIASLLSEGDSNGTNQRFIIIATPQGPNNEGGPSSRPANGPTADNHLHANPYPNTASPDQPRECEAGNENYVSGQTVIGNAPGNSGTKTAGQDSPSLSSVGSER